MPPQALQFIKGARLGREHVDKIVAVIRQNPFSVGKSFDADRIFAALIELLAYLFHNGLNLLRVIAAADHEKIGERGDFAQIQNSNIGGFL